MVPELIPVLGSQPAGDVSHKPGHYFPPGLQLSPQPLRGLLYCCLVNRSTVGLPKTVTRQRRDCDLNPGTSAPESSTLTTRLPSHPNNSTAYKSGNTRACELGGERRNIRSQLIPISINPAHRSRSAILGPPPSDLTCPEQHMRSAASFNIRETQNRIIDTLDRSRFRQRYTAERTTHYRLRLIASLRGPKEQCVRWGANNATWPL